MSQTLIIGKNGSNLKEIILSHFNNSEYFQQNYSHTGDGFNTPLFTYNGFNSEVHVDTQSENEFYDLLNNLLKRLESIPSNCNLSFTIRYYGVYEKDDRNNIYVTITFYRDSIRQDSTRYLVYENSQYTPYFYQMFLDINHFLNDNPDCRLKTNNCFLLNCFPTKYKKNI